MLFSRQARNEKELRRIMEGVVKLGLLGESDDAWIDEHGNVFAEMKAIYMDDDQITGVLHPQGTIKIRPREYPVTINVREPGFTEADLLLNLWHDFRTNHYTDYEFKMLHLHVDGSGYIEAEDDHRIHLINFKPQE